MTESDIIFEKDGYWVAKSITGGFDIYRAGITHSTRCAQIGFKGEKGLARAKMEIDRRIAEAESTMASRPQRPRARAPHFEQQFSLFH